MGEVDQLTTDYWRRVFAAAVNRADGAEAALRAIVQMAEDDPLAYQTNAHFHAAVTYARRGLDSSRLGPE